MSKQKSPPPRSTEPIVVVFGSERLAELWARRNAYNPRKIVLAMQGADKLRGYKGQIITVRFPKEIWEPTSNPCATRVREVETELKRIIQEGGDVIARLG